MADEGMTSALERIAYGSVAITTLALGEAALEITLPQWRVLVIAGGSGGDGATVSEIASRIGAAVSPASKLVTRLERRGLLRTAKDPADRRVTRVRLTESGAALRAQVMDCRRDYIRRVAASVGSAPAGTDAYLARLGEAFAALG
jgi:DNA-binding MarR family transcriptional regulator